MLVTTIQWLSQDREEYILGVIMVKDCLEDQEDLKRSFQLRLVNPQVNLFAECHNLMKLFKEMNKRMKNYSLLKLHRLHVEP